MGRDIILKTIFNDLELLKRGKTRDIYDLGDNLLVVASDRISAFDVILEDGIPEKGKVLNKISTFWFNKTKDIVENHVVETDVDKYPDQCRRHKDVLESRSMIVRKSDVIPIEAIVRGYISGSGWKEYQNTGSICGIELPDGLKESEKLPEPIFTPSTKAEIGDHDENISEEKAKELIGSEAYDFIKEKALEIYRFAYNHALERGIIIADTKMEFGYYEGRIILIDELLTPDSSRFWNLNDYKKGRAQNSFDKQYVRDYLLSINFNKQPPAPHLPDEVIKNTTKKYKEAYEKLTKA
jgi:phosphoribosylaminoimidazole-succinocarboxamide synthase